MVLPATRRFSLPLDVPETRGIRAWCLAPSVPESTVVSGLAGLWVWHGGRWPGDVCVVGRRGLHRVSPATVGGQERDQVTFHSGLAWVHPATQLGTVRLAHPARCSIDALRWEDHRLVIPAVVAAVRVGHVAYVDLVAAQGADNPRGAGYARLRHVWRVLAPVLRTAAQDASPMRDPQSA